MRLDFFRKLSGRILMKEEVVRKQVASHLKKKEFFLRAEYRAEIKRQQPFKFVCKKEISFLLQFPGQLGEKIAPHRFCPFPQFLKKLRQRHFRVPDLRFQYPKQILSFFQQTDTFSGWFHQPYTQQIAGHENQHTPQNFHDDPLQTLHPAASKISILRCPLFSALICT